MNSEYEGYADIDGERIPVICSYELDGYKPLGLDICTLDGLDITKSVPVNEYDRLYGEAYDEEVQHHVARCDFLSDITE